MRAFTFLEVVIVTAIALLVGMVAIWFTTNFFFDRQTVLTTQLVRSSFVRASMYAMNGKADSAWGVTRSEDNLVVFAGSTYAERNAVYDEVIPLPGNVSFTGFSEVIFARSTGTTTPLSFQVTSTARTINVSLTSEGAMTEL